MELTPFPAPLPCYGLELDMHDARCQKCPYMMNCHSAMGTRAWKVPLRRVRFDIIPRQFKIERNPVDPELTYINQLYSLCHKTIFGKHVNADLKRMAAQIADSTKELQCSIRLYILAAMIGHERHNEIVIGHTERDSGAPFKPKHLIEKRALEHVRMYTDICRQQFGTFTLGTLDLVNQSEYENADMEKAMLRSETLAGNFLIRFKASRRGLAEPVLYERHELDLDPHWLAVEQSYIDLYIDPPPTRQVVVDESTGTETVIERPAPKPPSSAVLEQRRFSAKQCKAFMSRNPTAGIVAHLARNNIMAEAVRQVLAALRFDIDDFEIRDEVIKNAFEFWKELGRAVQHQWCLHHYHGTTSVLQ